MIIYFIMISISYLDSGEKRANGTNQIFIGDVPMSSAVVFALHANGVTSLSDCLAMKTAVWSRRCVMEKPPH